MHVLTVPLLRPGSGLATGPLRHALQGVLNRLAAWARRLRRSVSGKRPRRQRGTGHRVEGEISTGSASRETEDCPGLKHAQTVERGDGDSAPRRLVRTVFTAVY